MDFHFIEMASFWGTGVVGSLATLVTVVVSKNEKLRKAAVFNLVSFLFTSIMVHLVVKKVLPNYALFFRLKDSWVPLTGFSILYYLIFTDYVFYLYHRFVHSVPLFWTGHFSHHSGDQMHPSLIIRDNVLAHVFALPLGLLGIPLGLNPHGVFVCVRFITFYQSFLHFPVTRDLPVLKYLIVTPYNHILHHSKTFDGYGQNFGGILSIWDRLCGTYRDSAKYLGEYGVEGLKNPNSLWNLNVLPISNLIRDCYRSKSLAPAVFFKKPGLKIPLNWTTVLYTFALLLSIDVTLSATKLGSFFHIIFP